MKLKHVVYAFLTFTLISCQSSPTKNNSNPPEVYADIQTIGAMRDVMWNGELAGKINLDTIYNQNGLYGLGPLSYLTGEILINNGKSYVSRVTSDSTMTVEQSFAASAPFFVYSHVTEWKKVTLHSGIKTIQDIEAFIDKETTEYKRPFTFKLEGRVKSATIHVQNLPPGTEVSSPKEAHQGQTNYQIANEDVEIIGFFSTAHKGVFTHHDSFLHMHLLTKNEQQMGHLDALEMDEMTLYLPVR